MARILVTGAAGYIGSVLIPELLQNGHEVIGIDSLRYHQISLLHICHHPAFTFIKGDIRDKALIEDNIVRCEYIIPLAAIVGMPACDKNPDEAVSVNLEGIKLLLKLRRGCHKIIYPTTNSGYGIGKEGIYCDENTPLNPISLYGHTKVEAEQLILSEGNAITFRLATVFGLSSRMRLDLLVNDFVFRACRDRRLTLYEPHFKRNYIHIRDVARVFLHAVNNFDRLNNEAYNVGLEDANLSKRELCDEIGKFLPDLLIEENEIGEDPDKRNYIVSNEKINKTGYHPAYTSQQGIQELINAYPLLFNKRETFTNL